VQTPGRRSRFPTRRPGNSVEKIRRHLERRIIQGALQPRQRIIEQEICRQVRLSRSPVREALRLLAADGLVEIYPRRGARVADITRAEIHDVFQVFEELEVLGTRLAAGRMTPEALTRLSHLMRAMQSAAPAGNVRSYFRLNARWHEQLYACAGNQKLALLLRNLGKQITRFRFAALAAPGRLMRSLEEHQALLAAVREGDEKRAVELVRASVANARQALTQHLGIQHEP
jgi:DNA-binding GntR family transcriptional regulator